MKVTRKNTPKEFSPVTLELTIESESELRTLYTLINRSNNEILEGSCKEHFDVKTLKDVADTLKFFEIVKAICEERL